MSGGPGADAERYALFGAVIEVLARVSDVARIVLVLDDLHWADAPTVSLLRHLATASEQLRVLVVATYRDAEVNGADALAGALAALHREDGVDRVHLNGLGGTEVLQLMERLAGHEMGEDGLALRDVLVHETEGNPFFVGEILRHLAEIGAIAQPEGRWIATTDLRTQGLPVSVREVIGRRVARLGDGTRRALEYASVVGRDFDLELLAELLELSNPMRPSTAWNLPSKTRCSKKSRPGASRSRTRSSSTRCTTTSRQHAVHDCIAASRRRSPATSVRIRERAQGSWRITGRRPGPPMISGEP